jgi:hypothetical protein
MGQREFKKLFTVEQANATLPLVGAIVDDLVRLSQQVIDRRLRIDHLRGGRDHSSGDFYDDELAHVEQELEKDSLKLQDYLEELRELGVVPTTGPGGFGIVDFPTRIDGRLAFLSWQHGEDEVSHWRELDADFSHRRRLPVMVSGEW